MIPIVERLGPAAVALLLAALALQAVLSMRLLSVTSDELTHLPSGYSYLETGDYRLNPQHPPLAKLLAAVPLLFLKPAADFGDPSFASDPPREWEFGFKFFESNDADRILFWGRLPIVLLSLITAWVVYRWARELFGSAAGLMALFLYALDPTVVAHSRWVTTDIPLSCFFLLTLYSLWKWVRGWSLLWAAATGLSLGAALATKYSALILLPLIALLTVVAVFLPGADGSAKPRPPRTAGRFAERKRRIARLAVSAVLILVLAAVVVFASYGFSGDSAVYWSGLQRVNQDHDPDYPYYLMGNFKTGGFPHYFLAAFVFKTPVPTLALLVLSIALFARTRTGRRIDDVFLAVPALSFFVLTSALADNLGVRYLLPIYPLVFIWVSRLAGLFTARAVGRAAGFALAGWYAVSALWIFPDHLSYFNELAGGPANGHRFLDDSNIDWGQDLKRLKDRLEREGIDRVRLRYGGNASANYYRIPWEPMTDRDWAVEPRPGVYAVSTHLLIRGEHYAKTQGVNTDWLTRYEPIGRVGYSIYLFRFP